MKPVRLNGQEIKRKYNNQWLLIGNPLYDRSHKIKKGKIIFHTEDREKLDKVLLETKEDSIAIRYVGTMEKDLSVILFL